MVLDSVYGFTSEEIARAIQGILETEVFFVQSEREVYAAVTALQSGPDDFADTIIAALGTWAGCDTTFTFDKKVSRIHGFTVLEAAQILIKSLSSPKLAPPSQWSS